jgi:hypothetical protein
MLVELRMFDIYSQICIISNYSLPGLRLPILFFLPLCPWCLLLRRREARRRFVKLGIL